MHEQWYPDRPAAGAGREFGEPGGGIVGEGLDRCGRRAEAFGIDPETATNGADKAIGKHHDWRYLDRIANHNRMVRTQERADRLLRRRLTSLVDEKPAERLGRELSEHRGDRGESRRDRRHNEKQARPDIRNYRVARG